MQQGETITFIILTNLIILILIIGVVLFVLQYRKKKLAHINEKNILNKEYESKMMLSKLETQSETMQHIGREIHDNVGQKLTLASLYVKQLNTGNITLSEKRILEVGNIIDESLADLRQLSKSLTQPELANASLFQLLRDETKRINAAGICHVSVSGNAGNTVLPQAEKNILFRILQEFIQNSLKHSGCRKISILVSADSGLLRINAADDGKGFEAATVHSGIGLQNMKRRAAQLNAAYQLNSSPGNGTQLSLQLNLH